MSQEHLFHSSLRKTIGFFLFAGLLIAIALFYIPRRPAFSDEKEFHLPLTMQFYHNPALAVITGEHYASANTPLPYIVSVGILKTIGLQPDIYKLRLINLSVYFFTIILLFYGYLKRDVWLLIIIACNVYLLKSAVMFYMSDWGLLFLCMVLILIKHKDVFPVALNMFLVILSSIFAIMSQQFYMVLPVAMLVGAYINNNYKVNKTLLPSVVAALSIAILPSLLFFQWGGLTHHNFNGYNPIAFAPTNITAILAIAGFHIAPFIIFKNFREKKFYRLYAVIAIICGVLLTPQYDHYMYEGAIVGITFRFINSLALHSIVGIKILTSVFVYFGILTFREVLLFGEKNIALYIEKSAVFLFAGIYVFTSHIGERHMIPMIFLLYLVILPRITNRKLLYIWAAVQFTVGIIYMNHLFHDLSIM